MRNIQTGSETKCSFIKMVAYELYKQDWINNHISGLEQLSSKRDYYIFRADCDEGEELLYEEWLSDIGFKEGLYSCFGEFCEMEYLWVDYMEKLLIDKKLINFYHDDIGFEQ